MTSFRKERTRLGLSLNQLGVLWGLSKAQLSLIERGIKPTPPWTKFAFPGLRRHFARKGREADLPPAGTHNCPECGSPMRTQSGYFAHWFHGRVNKRITCTGDPAGAHAPISLGILPDKTQMQRLDRTTNPHTGREVPLAPKRSGTSYEKRYGWVWCDSSSGRSDGCGWLCNPSGKYAFHARRKRKGKVFQIFKCGNPDCRYYRKRLKARGGKASDTVPSLARKTTLPKGAQHCPHCGGNTNRKAVAGVPVGMIQVVCTKCGKISYFHMQARKFAKLPCRVNAPRARRRQAPRRAYGRQSGPAGAPQSESAGSPA